MIRGSPAPWAACCPPLLTGGSDAPHISARIVLDRNGTGRSLRGAIDLAARLCAPMATSDRLPVSTGLAPPRSPKVPTIWLSASGGAAPHAPLQVPGWPAGSEAWAWGEFRPAPMWRMGGSPAAVTDLLRALSDDPGERTGAAVALAWTKGRLWRWVPGSAEDRWQGVGRGRQRTSAASAPVLGVARLLPGSGLPPPRTVVPDATPAATMAAMANLAARLALGSSSHRHGPLGLQPSEPAARSGEVRLELGGERQPQIARGPGGRAVISGGQGVVPLLERLASADPLGVQDPLELMADMVRWPAPGTEPSPRPRLTLKVEAGWEGERLKGAARAVAGRPRSHEVASVEVFASEPGAVRDRLGDEIAGILGLARDRVTCQPAYHQAAWWLAHTVVDRLAGLQPTSLQLEVPRGAAPRTASWAITVRGGLEQLAFRLGVDAKRVTITVAAETGFVDGGGSNRYVLRARAATGVTSLSYCPLTVLGGAWEGDSTETAGLRVTPGSRRKLEVPVESDHAAVVRLYESQVLPRALALARRGHTIRVELSAAVSEPDGEELLPDFSPLEELHEELYFRTHATSRARHARLVLVPDIRLKVAGRAVLSARMYDLGLKGQTVTEAHPRLEKISLAERAGTGLVLEVSWDQHGPRAASGCGQESPHLRPLDRGGRRWVWTDHVGSRVAATPDPARLPVPELLSRRLAQRRLPPGTASWVIGRSTLGQTMVAVAALPWSAALGSLAKATLLRPTVLLIGGHHGNEVSSTPNHLQLIDDLAHGWRPESVLILLPLENPDGAAVHRRLARIHPTWKLHAARFNGVGEEFGGTVSPWLSPFGEARPRDRLLTRYGADCLVDDHGVPDHVWAQPLAGRSSPPLFPIAYTLPPGLLYLIGETEPDGHTPSGWTAAVHSAVASGLASDPDLRARHDSLWDSYVRYGAGLDPIAFPSVARHGLPLQARRRRQRRREHVRFPVALDMVTEVADETSQGPDLVLAVRAHRVADLALLGEAGRAKVSASWAATADGWRLRRIGVCPPPTGVRR
jgi:hypothetical protein